MNREEKTRELIRLERDIARYNFIRDDLYYSRIIRLIASIYSYILTRKWERWND